MKSRSVKKMIPRSGRDKITLCFFILGIPFSMWFELNFVVTDSTSGMIKLHLTCASLLAIQVFWNLFYMLRTDTTVQSIDSDLPQSFLYAIICDKCGKTPPRSHHCKVCDVCILKRDHHCWFAGYCIGYLNHRYYLMTIMYCWIAGLYANIVHFKFMISTLGISFRTLISIVAPHFVWVTGYYTNYEFFIAAIFDVSIYFMALLTWLLYRQFAQVIGGQTAFERSAGTTKFDKGLMTNIQEILGQRWSITWLAPCIPSALPSIENHWLDIDSKIKDD